MYSNLSWNAIGRQVQRCGGHALVLGGIAKTKDRLVSEVHRVDAMMSSLLKIALHHMLKCSHRAKSLGGPTIQDRLALAHSFMGCQQRLLC